MKKPYELAAGLRQPFRLTRKVNSKLLMAGRFAFGKTVPSIFENALAKSASLARHCPHLHGRAFLGA